jgi:chromosome segregation ATPase
MSSGQAHGMTSDRDTARSEAKANLLLALYSHASHDLELSRAEAEVLRSQLADLRREFEQASRQLGELGETSRQLGEANRQLGQTRLHLGEANRQLGEAHSETERVHRQLHSALSEVDRLTERNAHLERQFNAVLTSTSWRVTAPIRAVARVIKRQ